MEKIEYFYRATTASGAKVEKVIQCRDMMDALCQITDELGDKVEIHELKLNEEDNVVDLMPFFHGIDESCIEDNSDNDPAPA